MSSLLRYHILLQLVVLIAGFTGILGDLIELPAEKVTFFRTAIASLSLIPILIIGAKSGKISASKISKLLLTGIIVGLHWYTFFHSIKVSTVSIAVICMSTATFFMAFIEPLILKRQVLKSEIVLSVFIIVGMILIYGYESNYFEGIFYGVLSALLATIFTALNAKHVENTSSTKITFYEMLGACITMFITILITEPFTYSTFEITNMDLVYLLILGIICTSFAFLLSVYVMKKLSPFTVSISLNLEPIYTILMVLFIDWYMGTENEKMSLGFYLGGTLILSTIFINAYLKKKKGR